MGSERPPAWKGLLMQASVTARPRLGRAFPAAFGLAVALGFGIGAAYAASSTPAPNTVLARFPSDLDTRAARAGQHLSLEDRTAVPQRRRLL